MVYGIHFKVIKGTSKVTKVTTGHMPKPSRPPKELEVGPRSGPYLLVVGKVGSKAGRNKIHIGFPKMHGRICIGLPKMHGQIRIGLPKVHGRFRIGPPKVFHPICPQ